MQTTQFYVPPRDPTTGRPSTAGDRTLRTSNAAKAGVGSRPTSRPSTAGSGTAAARFPGAAIPKTSTSRPQTASSKKGAASSSSPARPSTAPAAWRPPSTNPVRPAPAVPASPPKEPRSPSREAPMSPRTRVLEEEYRILRRKYEYNIKALSQMTADRIDADERARQLEEGFENSTYNYGLIKFHHDRLRRGQKSISEDVLRSMLKPVHDGENLLASIQSRDFDQSSSGVKEGMQRGAVGNDDELSDEEEMEAKALADKYLRADAEIELVGSGGSSPDDNYDANADAEERHERTQTETEEARRDIRRMDSPYAGKLGSAGSSPKSARRVWTAADDYSTQGSEDIQGVSTRWNADADRALEQAWKRRMLIEPEVEEPDAAYPDDDDIEDGVYADSRGNSRAGSRVQFTRKGHLQSARDDSDEEEYGDEGFATQAPQRSITPGDVEDGCYEYSEGGDVDTRREDDDEDDDEADADENNDDGEGAALTEDDLRSSAPSSPSRTPARPSSRGSGGVLKNESLLDRSAEKISRMWEDFAVESYEPKVVTRARPAERAKGEQRPRHTVPEPFQFHYRPRVHTRSERMMEDELTKKRVEEEALVKRTGAFRANPLPATTLLPMYEQMEVEKERRREEIRRQTHEKLAATQKPFSFYERDVANREHRLSQRPPTPPYPKPVFKAQPPPPSVTHPKESYEARVAEEEALRQLRIRRRAQELMLQASLPSNMLYDRLADTHERRKVFAEREQRAFFTQDHTFHPWTHGDPPDFELLNSKIDKELHVRKEENKRRSTVMRPFELRTERIPSRKDAVYEDVLLDEMKLKETRWPFTMSRRPPVSGQVAATPPPAKPTRMTKASKMRENVVRRSLRDEEYERQREARTRQLEAERLRMLTGQVVRRVAAKDIGKKREDDRIRKVAVFRANDRRRQEEYQRQLEEIETRTSQRPLIFERPSEVDARKAVERRLEAALAEAGLSAKEIRDIRQYLGPTGKIDDVEGLFRREKGRSVAYDPTRYSDAGDSSHLDDASDEGSLEQRLWTKSPASARKQHLDDGDSELAMSGGTYESATATTEQSSASASASHRRGGSSSVDKARSVSTLSSQKSGGVQTQRGKEAYARDDDRSESTADVRSESIAAGSVSDIRSSVRSNVSNLRSNNSNNSNNNSSNIRSHNSNNSNNISNNIDAQGRHKSAVAELHEQSRSEDEGKYSDDYESPGETTVTGSDVSEHVSERLDSEDDSQGPGDGHSSH